MMKAIQLCFANNAHKIGNLILLFFQDIVANYLNVSEINIQFETLGCTFLFSCFSKIHFTKLL